jgi:hypothetical protein
LPDAKEKKTKSEPVSEPPKKEMNMHLDMGALITSQKREHKRDETAPQTQNLAGNKEDN